MTGKLNCMRIRVIMGFGNGSLIENGGFLSRRHELWEQQGGKAVNCKNDIQIRYSIAIIA